MVWPVVGRIWATVRNASSSATFTSSSRSAKERSARICHSATSRWRWSISASVRSVDRRASTRSVDTPRTLVEPAGPSLKIATLRSDGNDSRSRVGTAKAPGTCSRGLRARQVVLRGGLLLVDRDVAATELGPLVRLLLVVLGAGRV